MTRQREVIEEDIRAAEQDIEIIRQALEVAKSELCDLLAELEALPPEGVDAELWAARRDPRQLRLDLSAWR